MEVEQPRIWSTTELWAQLKDRGGEPAGKLAQMLPDALREIEVVLNKGGTSPPTFTLHDAEHSWRVAWWMADLAGSELLEELSALDLAMLLLSAYLHDIGMTPPLGKVDAHTDFLLTGELGALTEDQGAELQEWLDNEWNGIEPPIANIATNEDIGRARQIAAEYVRHRHNDWSESWIRGYFDGIADDPYAGWVDDLVRLCKSHHFGIDELLGEDFAPRRVGNHKTVLHLRYCACLLRLADILDFDPERTPPILFKHRGIKGDSVIHWRKNLGVHFTREGQRLSLKARPEDALTHHAILRTIADVDRELTVCRQLDDVTDFRRLPGSETPLPHRWTLELGVKCDVQPQKNTYDYVDGTFRPDTERLLDLLGGIELYKSRLAAVREILQNAFDAVREQVARERLSEPDPGSSTTRDQLAAHHSVLLELRRFDSGLRLICRDTGVGMSREIISGRFLVGGSVAGHDIRRLERECAKHGFTVERTAQFGIGVLSYFLLAGKLVLRTRRSDQGGDPDGTGWIFTSLGLADFGQLERDSDSEPGTTVEIDILSSAMDDGPEALAEELADYLNETVRRTPCPFSFRADDLGIPGFDLDGWPDRTDEVRRDFAEAGWLDPGQEETMRVSVHEGSLKDNLGVFRIFTGYFEFDSGSSPVCLELESAGGNRHFIKSSSKLDGAMIAGRVRQSWNGMLVTSEDELESLPLNTQVEIDWTKNPAGRLDVDRKSFTPSEMALEAAGFVSKTAKALLEDLVGEQDVDSPYGLLNNQFADEEFGRGHPVPAMPYWLHSKGDSELRWHFAPLGLPVIDKAYIAGDNGLRWRGKTVTSPAEIELRAPEGGRSILHWYRPFKPQYVGAIKVGDLFEPTAVWEKFEPYDISTYRPHRRTAKFPPEWRALAGCGLLESQAHPTIWNQHHPLLRAVDNASWEWAEETFGTLPDTASLNPLPHQKALLDSEGRVAAWMLMCLEVDVGNAWNDLHTYSDFLLEAWEKVKGLSKLGRIVYVSKTIMSTTLVVVTPSTLETYAEDLWEKFLRELGVPGNKWLLTPLHEGQGDDPGRERGED